MRSKALKGRAAWTRIIERFEKTELTHAEFCEARSLNLGSFRTWLYRLRNEQGRGEARGKLVELVAVPQRTDDGSCIVRVGATEVRFPTRPEVEYLSALLRAVEER
jgi:hypothetical protein